MKKLYTLVSAVLLSASLWAQAPKKMSYQAVIRGVNNALVIDKPVGVRVSIIQGTEFGASVYVETHTPTTNANGLASLSLGTGKIITGEFSKIDWSKGPYFVKTETDVEGGTNYQLTLVSELMSVPYALYAANSQPGPKGDKGDPGAQGPAGKDGVDGKNGLDGKDGVPGPKGDKGEIGTQGPAGKDGINGVDGKDGVQGPKGDKGEIGAQGLAGKDGINGVDGKDGVQGPKGDKGETGGQGPAGKDGINGVDGKEGVQGPKGEKGETGAQGPAGKDGINGVDGKDGVQGPKGDTGAQGPQGFKGDTGLTGAQGPKGDTGAQGPQGLKGDTGLTGAQGQKGDQGNGFSNGTVTGEMKYWDGTTWNTIIPGYNGQGLTFCEGIPTWTSGGVCPGKVSSIDCATATNNGNLTSTTAASGVTSLISYLGGNGGTYNGQVLASTVVTGLTATLQSGTFANGNGSLTYTITGTPSTSGTASFALNIGGKTCTLTRTVAIVSQNPTSGYGPNITDLEDNSYKTVYIGSQHWMGENLKVSKYNDGTNIPNITESWINLTTNAWTYYNNDATNNFKYGKLYNWYAVSPTTNGNKNLCPTGWHVPTDGEWTVLTDYLGGQSIAGGKMKEVGTTSWNRPNTDATNTSLFTGLPGGYLDGGHFDGIGNNGSWWSSTVGGISRAWSCGLDVNSGAAGKGNGYKLVGLSVRCIKD